MLPPLPGTTTDLPTPGAHLILTTHVRGQNHLAADILGPTPLLRTRDDVTPPLPALECRPKKLRAAADRAPAWRSPPAPRSRIPQPAAPKTWTPKSAAHGRHLVAGTPHDGAALDPGTYAACRRIGTLSFSMATANKLLWCGMRRTRRTVPGCHGTYDTEVWLGGDLLVECLGVPRSEKDPELILGHGEPLT